jgi:putative sterol carrier protein
VTYESAQQFFDELAANADASRVSDLTASYRFDIEGAGTWRVEVRAGVVTVEQSQEPAGCMIATDEQTFLGVVQNQLSPIGAFMTGKIRVEGDMGLALRLRELIG